MLFILYLSQLCKSELYDRLRGVYVDYKVSFVAVIISLVHINLSSANRAPIMPPQELSDLQSVLIGNVAKKLGFQDFRIQAEVGSEKGDNYLGIITNITVENEEKKLNFILKTSHSDEKFRDNMQISTIYEREIYVYEKLFPLLDNIQEEFKVKHTFKGHASSFGSYVDDTTESLIMEDIRDRGFKLWNRKLPMTSEHITAVVKEYARLHSLGMIMKNKKPELFKEVDVNMYEIWGSKPSDNDDRLRMFTGFITEKLFRVVGSDDTRTIEALKPHTDNLVDYYKFQVKKPEFKLAVLHGDCWCNNMMFRYKVS